MLVLGELALGLGTDAQGWRIRSDTIRKVSLELLELPKKNVVLRVRDGRTVENVVFVGCPGEQDAQLRRALIFLPRRLARRLWFEAGSRGCLPLLWCFL